MVIIDSSVVFKWFDRGEILNEEAMKLLEEHLSSRIPIFIPELIFYELTNAWATKSALTEEEIIKNLQTLLEYNLNIISVEQTLFENIVRFSKKYRVTTYDGVYAILAEENQCDLVTADDKFADKLNLPFVKKLSDYE